MSLSPEDLRDLEAQANKLLAAAHALERSHDNQKLIADIKNLLASIMKMRAAISELRANK